MSKEEEVSKKSLAPEKDHELDSCSPLTSQQLLHAGDLLLVVLSDGGNLVTLGLLRHGCGHPDAFQLLPEHGHLGLQLVQLGFALLLPVPLLLQLRCKQRKVYYTGLCISFPLIPQTANGERFASHGLVPVDPAQRKWRKVCLAWACS